LWKRKGGKKVSKRKKPPPVYLENKRGGKLGITNRNEFYEQGESNSDGGIKGCSERAEMGVWEARLKGGVSDNGGKKVSCRGGKRHDY